MTDPTRRLRRHPRSDATPEQDADVRALLAFLRDEPLEMPPDVAARLDAVLAEERRTAALANGSASAVLDPSDGASTPHASVTVLPTLAQRRGPSMRAFTIVGGVAAAALVVVGGITLAGSPRRRRAATRPSTAAGASAAASGAPGRLGRGHQRQRHARTPPPPSRRRRRPWSPASRRVGQRLGGRGHRPCRAAPPRPTASTDGVAASSRPGSPPTPPTQPLGRRRQAASCVTALTDGDGSTAVAIDSGTFNGKPALVVVVTDPDDPAALRVFVTAPDCSPSFLQYQQIAKP